MAVLGSDLGTSGAKVGLVSEAGEVLAVEFEPVPLQLQPGGGAEQRPEDWWAAIVKAAQRLPRQDLRAIGLTAQWAGTVAVDAGGEPLAPAIIWMDARGAAHARRLAGGRGRGAGGETRPHPRAGG